MNILITKIKKYVYFIIDSIITILSITHSKNVRKSIIIIRNDAIGDYLLFRDFLKILREQFCNYHITLLGNIIYKDIALCLDSEYIDEFIWINNKKFRKNIFYSISFLRDLKKKKFEILINPIQSRDINNVILSNAIKAHKKFASQGDNININPKIKNKNDRIYTKLFKSNNDVIFEFYRNNEFINHLLNKTINIKPHINGKLFNYKPNISNYSVLFIGASVDYRKWGIGNFAIIGKYLIKKYNQNIILCGGKEDIENSKILESKINVKNKVINMVGKTSLTTLGGIVYNGNLLISNETSCAHLGALLDKTIIIVVSNGNHLGRFIPYPKSISDKYYPVFHPFIENNLQNYKQLSNQYKYKSDLDINEINVKNVINKIDYAIKNNL